MYRRLCESRLHAALARAPLVLLQGARATGKRTLARRIAAETAGHYLSLDDPATLRLARTDPDALLDQAGGRPTLIAEVQQAPSLFPALAEALRKHPRPGRLLLTASADVAPALASAPDGAVEILRLAPLTAMELHGGPDDLIEHLFDGWPDDQGEIDRDSLCTRILAGGFPEALARAPGKRRDQWCQDHLTALLRHDARELRHIDGLHELPRLLELLAARSGALLNIAEISRAVGIAHSTLRRYLALLEALFIFTPLPAWTPDGGPRCVKSARIELMDSGLTAFLQGEHNATRLARSASFGALLESYLVQQIRGMLDGHRRAATIAHFRTATGQKVDLVIEDPEGRIVAIDIRASSRLTPDDFNGLRTLARIAGERFVRGIVLYPGAQRLQLSGRLAALPVSAVTGAEIRPDNR